MAKKSKKQDVQQPQPQPTVLSSEQEINALRAAHAFFSNYDRVPGFLGKNWSDALDAIGIVANSLIGKYEEAQKEAAKTEAASSSTPLN